jgi:threonine aldolase
MVFFDIDPGYMTAADFCKALEREGVRALPNAPQRVRAVFHLDVEAERVEEAVGAVAKCAAGAASPARV